MAELHGHVFAGLDRRRVVVGILTASLFVAPWGASARNPEAVATPSIARPPEPPSPGEEYERGLDLYQHGDYELAAETLGNFLLSPPVGFDPGKLKRARLYRGISLFQSGERDGAYKEFWQVLLMDPDFRPDPLLTEPAVIAAFDRIRAENAAELKKLPRNPRRTPELPRDALGIPLVPQSGAGFQGEFWRSIAPFGVAQFHNGQKAKAYTILGLESTLLVANLSTAVALYSMQIEDGKYDRDTLAGARLAKTVNNVSFFLLIGAIFYGSADGVWNSLQRENAAASPSIRPSPGPGPGDAGVSLNWRF